MTAGTVIVFAKAPQAGRVKTRLARHIGAGRAVSIFRATSAATFAAVACGSWRRVIAIDPPSAVFAQHWPAGFDRLAQAPGDLGARLRAAMRAAPSGPVVFIGADAPQIRAFHLRAAFAALKGADAVFGPAPDGGFWLAGLARRRPVRNAYLGVRWSSAHALADALASLPAGHTVAFLESLRDIDGPEDLAALGPLSKARAR